MPIYGNSGPNSSLRSISGPAANQPAACPQSGNLTRQALFSTAAAFLLPMAVFGMVGESNTVEARCKMNELPSGIYTTDANAFIWDDGDTLGLGQAIRVLGAPSYATVTITIASPGVIAWTAHGLPSGTPIIFQTTGALPTGLVVGTRYWLVNPSPNSFQVAATPEGPAINTSGTQSGVHTAFANPGVEQQPGGNAYVDPAYPVGFGGSYEFVRHFRADNPSSPVCVFIAQQGGGRFTDAASRGRAANYNPALTDGAYAEMKTSWAAFVSALAALGYYPNIIVWRINLGGNSSFDATESANFQTDLSNFIAQLRTDIIGNAKVVLDRYGAVQAGFNQANMPTIRTAVQNIVLADPTRVELLSLDGMPTVGSYGGPDSLHLTVAAHIAIGEALYYHAAGYWYPQKEQAFNGGNPASFEWRPGDWRNVFDGSGNVQTIYDVTDKGVSPTNATSTERPAVTTINNPNGYPARHGTADGVDDILVKAGSAKLMDGSFGVFGAVKMAATSGVAIMSEGGTAIYPFYAIRSTAAGALEMFHRTDDPPQTVTQQTLVTGVFNNVRNFFAVWDNASQAQARVNGTTGTAFNYTRGTTTTNRMALFGLSYNNGASNVQKSPAQVGILWGTDAIPDATYLANAYAYTQRRWGTLASTSTDLTALTVATAAPALSTTSLGQVHGLGSQALETTAPLLSSASLGQVHALGSGAVTTTAPALSSSALGQVHALASTTLATAAPALSTAALGQVHAITSVTLATSAPALGTATLGQVHILSSLGLAAGTPAILSATLGIGGVGLTSQTVATTAPAIGSSSIGQVHALGAQTVAAGTAFVGTATFGQVHTLTSQAVAPVAVAIGSASIGQVHALTAAQVATGAAVVTSASMGGTIALASNTVSTSAPIIASAGIGQTHTLASLAVAPGAPSVAIAALGQTHSLGSVALTGGVPALGLAAIGQVHILAATGVSTFAPALSPSSLSGAQGLVSQPVTTSSPALSVSLLAQTHAFSSLTVATSPPVLAQGVLGTVHAFASQPVVTSSAALGLAALGQRHALLSGPVATFPPQIGGTFLTYVLPTPAATFGHHANPTFTSRRTQFTFRRRSPSPF